MVWCLYTHTHTPTHTRMHARTHARTHAHMHTHTLTAGQSTSSLYDHLCEASSEGGCETIIRGGPTPEARLITVGEQPMITLYRITKVRLVSGKPLSRTPFIPQAPRAWAMKITIHWCLPHALHTHLLSVAGIHMHIQMHCYF